MNTVIALFMKIRRHESIMRFILPILLICGLAGLTMSLAAQNLFAQEPASTGTSVSSDPLFDFSCPDGPDCITNRYPDRVGKLPTPPDTLRSPVARGGPALPTPTPSTNGNSHTSSDAQIEQSDNSGLSVANTASTSSRGGEDNGSAPIVYRLPASFSQGFDDVTLLPGQDWFFRNNSSPVGEGGASPPPDDGGGGPPPPPTLPPP